MTKKPGRHGQCMVATSTPHRQRNTANKQWPGIIPAGGTLRRFAHGHHVCSGPSTSWSYKLGVSVYKHQGFDGAGAVQSTVGQPGAVQFCDTGVQPRLGPHPAEHPEAPPQDGQPADHHRRLHSLLVACQTQSTSLSRSHPVNISRRLLTYHPLSAFCLSVRPSCNQLLPFSTGSRETVHLASALCQCSNGVFCIVYRCFHSARLT